MAFSWTESITQGDKILEAVLQEIRDNLDALESGGGIESGTYMYFYQSSAPTGWTTNSGLGDRVLGVHGSSTYAGSSGGGESQGTWTQPDHTHTGPNHGHQWYNWVSGASDQSYNSGGSGTNLGTSTKTGVGFYATTGSSTKADTDYYTSYAGTGATGGSATTNTWRPFANVGILASKDA